MPRPSLQDNVDKGILTIPNVAKLLNISPRKAKEILELENDLLSVTIFNEQRYSGKSILKLAKRKKIPYNIKLQEASDNFEKLYNDNWEPKVQQMDKK